jgi:hypothetical protein
MIEGAAKMGAQQAAEPQHLTEVQKLTQENLAKLVKETAIKSGAVMPGGYRRASTALPQAPTRTMVPPTATAPRKAQSAINGPTTTRRSAVPMRAKPITPVVKKPVQTAGKLAAPSKSKPAVSTGPTKEITLASGVTIKVPKTEVEEAKKTGIIVLKNGMKIKVEKDEIEEAQKKKGSTIMTASGVPIKISPTGAITVEQKPTANNTSAKKPPPTLVKPTPRLSPAAQKSAGPAKLSGTGPVAKKASVPVASAGKPLVAPVKKKITSGTPKKL